MSQEKLAEKIDISTTHMSHIETGSTKLSLPVLVAIAEALETDTDSLLFDETNNPGRMSRSDSEEILKLLNDCTTQQKKVIFEILKSAKKGITTFL